MILALWVGCACLFTGICLGALGETPGRPDWLGLAVFVALFGSALGMLVGFGAWLGCWLC